MSKPDFADVSPHMNSYSAIKELRDEGWVVGIGGNQFKPWDTLTRAEIAVMIVRAKHGPKYKPPNAQGVIPDVPASYWGAKWIEQAVKEGMDLYWDGNFYPREAARRADMAVLVWLLK